jgi:GMP synthase-like glutamine amidotransferase
MSNSSVEQAAVIGGQVRKSEKGPGIGLQRYDVLHRTPWMDGPASITMAASHQDQVVAAPAGARVVVASDFAPFAGPDYGNAISFQFHPEFTAAFGTALIELRRDRYGALAGTALKSYGGPDDCVRVRNWIRSFLRREFSNG